MVGILAALVRWHGRVSRLIKPFIRKRGNTDGLLTLDGVASILVWPGILLNVAFNSATDAAIIIFSRNGNELSCLAFVLICGYRLRMSISHCFCAGIPFTDALSIANCALSILFEIFCYFHLLTAYLVAVLISFNRRLNF